MDPFLIDGYDLSYNTNSRFSQTERYLGYGQASDVSNETLYIWVHSDPFVSPSLHFQAQRWQLLHLLLMRC
jgi:hypothetical protein